MVTDADPVVGNWYEYADNGQPFEVVAVDEENGVVEIQDYDGSLEEIELEAWYDLNLRPIEPPEDWTGPVDDVERDDLGYSETGMDDESWSRPVRGKRRQREEWQRPQSEEQPDEWGDEGPQEEPWDGEE